MNEAEVSCTQPGNAACHLSAEASEMRDLPCFCCGICCEVYQVRISQAEARLIADKLRMEYWDWVGLYCDSRWPDPRSHLIRHDEHGCVFLQSAGSDGALCGIYEVRPYSCRAWSASVFKPACQEGLRRFWQIEVDASGQLHGSNESLKRVRQFMAQR